jgi:hypothetical protein
MSMRVQPAFVIRSPDLLSSRVPISGGLAAVAADKGEVTEGYL